ncbi:MAG: 3-hydroxyacyl-CoA dehydrogenase [Beijerinckiaceae bacterium]|nr:3-hydroxyacyl-CoA dehydrogenase [Beijerinckiaceae bacterium]
MDINTLREFKVTVEPDGIALILWDMPGRSMNVFTENVIRELSVIVEHVAGNSAIKGAIIASGKPDSFSGGADLTMLEGIALRYAAAVKTKGEENAIREFYDETRHLTLLFRRIETCGKPFVAAINGICVGGAFEMSLACHRRIVSSHPKTRVGLPEIKVGIFPGGGGTQRVARLMPTDHALQLLFRGDQIKPDFALKFGLVHEVVRSEDLLDAARAALRKGVSPIAPWDEERFKLPSNKVFSPQGMMIWPAANAIYRRETYDNYPAAKAILQSVHEGLQLPMDQALTVESRYFAHVLRTPEARAMIRTLFVSMQEINKGARRPKDVPPAEIKRLGIIGAGFMGQGIASVAARAGIDVVMIDRDEDSAKKGRTAIETKLAESVGKGRVPPDKAFETISRIKATADYHALAGCDLVIEAVFEDPKVKAETLGRVAALVGDTVIASNTSTLPISGLAKAVSHPTNFIGIHFFSPVEKMMLVEIIMGKETGDRALATALDFVRKIGKTPIVVNDARGFYANRCVGAYIREGQLMLQEGVPAALIENAARMAGMPVGPLALNDEVGLDLAWRIVKGTRDQLGDAAVDLHQFALLQALVEREGRLGRKNGKGFYDYPADGPKRLWPGLTQFAQTARDPDAIDVATLKQRFLIAQALEAARTYLEGIVTDPREADVGAILGFGFAPFTGGPLSMIDGMGLGHFVALCDQLKAAYGERFDVPASLRDKASRNETFYPRAPHQAAA